MWEIGEVEVEFYFDSFDVLLVVNLNNFIGWVFEFVELLVWYVCL